MSTFEKRVTSVGWASVATEIDYYRCPLPPQLLTPPECATLIAVSAAPRTALAIGGSRAASSAAVATGTATTAA
ncbi:hypothetical protein [Amycolatopsis sp. WQ 127309]|uniref:hypothetical protein n=1 Tax=Amycolatopsis sp. WQ 127309 TaxID=2932773 RepID=UPI001FF6B5F3|nr:hypothetical protein [Amycolatopsis sp. WQ 127309]UOZ05216.1 hypothetical protein MUY22_41340 [Amycolatopsis sp. WQ 127309]